MPSMKITPGAAGVGTNPAPIAPRNAAYSATAGDARDADTADQKTVLEQWNAAGIDGVWIAVVQIRLAGLDSEPGLRPVDGARGRNFLAQHECRVESAAAIGVLDSVQRRVRREADSGRKVNAADEADCAAGKRSLIVAEERRRARQRHGQLIRIHARAEIADGGIGRIPGFETTPECCPGDP